MAEIVNFAAERDRRNAPDPDCISADADGRLLFEFLVEFKQNGTTIGDTIRAYDLEDAERIIAEFRDSLVVIGGPLVARV